MIGKVIKVDDYKFIYGQDTIYINIYGAFKYKKNGNKYIIYSYDDKKLYYGSLFVKNNSIVIMTSKEDAVDIIKTFIDNIMNGKSDENFEIISLDNIVSSEIIDQNEIDMNINININKLKDITIPKLKSLEKDNVKRVKKKISPIWTVIILVIIIVAVFLFVNPEIIMGKNSSYLCTKSYFHDKLPATVVDNVSLVFNGQDKIVDINITSDYIFTDTAYYKEFEEKSYFYQYIKEGDTYKFVDEDYTYKLFSKIDTEIDYFMPRDMDELISYYKNNKYTCKLVEEE